MTPNDNQLETFSGPLLMRYGCGPSSAQRWPPPAHQCAAAAYQMWADNNFDYRFLMRIPIYLTPILSRLFMISFPITYQYRMRSSKTENNTKAERQQVSCTSYDIKCVAPGNIRIFGGGPSLGRKWPTAACYLCISHPVKVNCAYRMMIFSSKV